MSIVSKAQLKADFLDGKIITEDKMDDLIDSTYNPNLVAGTDITLVPSGNDITINSTGGGALSIEDEGVLIDAATVLIDFVGVGVTATSTGAGSVEVNIPGGGGVPNLQTVMDIGSIASVASDITIQTAGEIRLYGDIITVGLGAATTLISLDANTLNVGNTGSTDFTNIGANSDLRLEASYIEIKDMGSGVDITSGNLLNLISTGLAGVNVEAEDGEVIIESTMFVTGPSSAKITLGQDIQFVGTGLGTPDIGDVLSAKDVAGNLEWTTPNVQVAVFTIDEIRMQTLDVTPETLVAIPPGKFLIILSAMAIIYVPFTNNVNLQIEYAGCNIASNMMWGTIPEFTKKSDNTGCYFNPEIPTVAAQHQFGENCTLELSLSGASGLPSMASSTSVVWVSYMIVDA